MPDVKRSNEERWRDFGRMDGRRAGQALGLEHGYFLGRCERIVRDQSNRTFSYMDIHVVYVTAGIGVPYPALDASIIDALSTLVRKVTTMTPSEDVAAWVARHQPDLVIVLNGVAFPAEQAEAIREMGIPSAVWFTDDPYYTDWTITIAPRYEYVFTLELNCLPFYRELGCKQVYYLPFGVNPGMYHPRLIDNAYRSDVCFIGTAFWNRVKLIDDIAEALSGKRVIIAGWWWDRLNSYNKLAQQIRLGDWLSPEETSAYYHGAKVVINLHREAEDATINYNTKKIKALSVNPRTFEILGSGTLQLSDTREDMSSWYTPGKEIVTYDSPDRLVQLIEYYLRHEEERREIAWNGLARTMKEHTYRDRLSWMLKQIFEGGQTDGN